MTATGARGLRGAESIGSYGGFATATAGGGSGGARRGVTPVRRQPRARAAHPKIARSGVPRSARMGTAVFGVRRAGTRIMVRANRYALASAMNGRALEPWVRALHGCDNSACVRASLPGETGLLHIIGGSQARQHADDGAGPPGGGRVLVRRVDHGVKARRARGGGATRSGAPRLGRRSCRGGAAGLERPDPVVSRTATTHSEHGGP